MPTAPDPDPDPVTTDAGAPRTLVPRFERIALVCKACEKRSKGPKKLTARELARRIVGAAREAELPRARAVLTGCLGACPKKAFTVVAAAPGRAIVMIAFRRGDDARLAAQALFGPTRSSPSPSE